MKNIITLAVSFFSLTIFAQVGINNNTPKATLDITAQTTNGSKPEGLLAPRLTGDQIQAGDAQYTAAQAGIIIYATAAATAPSIKTASITAAGYYFYDGSAWQKLTNGASAADATTTAKGIVQLAGDLSGTAASPAIAANAVTSGKILDGTVANADLAAGTGGIYKGSGSLSGNTTVTQGANTLAFTSTATNGFSVDGTTLSVDAANNRVGIGTTAPTATLEVNSGTSDVSGLKFSNLTSSSAIGIGQSLGVDSNGNVITVPNNSSTTITTSESFLGGSGGFVNPFNVSDLGWTIVSNSSQNINIPLGGKAVFINFMLGIDYASLPAGGGIAYYTAKLYIDGVATNVFMTTQEPAAGAQTQFSLSCVKFLSPGAHTLDVRMSRTFNNSTTSGAVMSCGVMSMSFNASYIN